MVGDGEHTIDELIETQINLIRRRGVEHEFPHLIEARRYPRPGSGSARASTGASVPPAGQER